MDEDSASNVHESCHFEIAVKGAVDEIRTSSQFWCKPSPLGIDDGADVRTTCLSHARESALAAESCH